MKRLLTMMVVIFTTIPAIVACSAAGNSTLPAASTAAGGARSAQLRVVECPPGFACVNVNLLAPLTYTVGANGYLFAQASSATSLSFKKTTTIAIPAQSFTSTAAACTLCVIVAVPSANPPYNAISAGFIEGTTAQSGTTVPVNSTSLSIPAGTYYLFLAQEYP